MDYDGLPRHPPTPREGRPSWRDIDWIPLLGRLIINGVIWGFVALAYMGMGFCCWAHGIWTWVFR